MIPIALHCLGAPSHDTVNKLPPMPTTSVAFIACILNPPHLLLYQDMHIMYILYVLYISFSIVSSFLPTNSVKAIPRLPPVTRNSVPGDISSNFKGGQMARLQSFLKYPEEARFRERPLLMESRRNIANPGLLRLVRSL